LAVLLNLTIDNITVTWSRYKNNKSNDNNNNSNYDDHDTVLSYHAS